MRNIFDGTSRVLVLSAHTDDAELACGGTIARLLANGAEVSVAAFSTAQESLPAGSPADRLRGEYLRAMAMLGVEPDRTFVYGYPVRRLSHHRQELLEELVKLKRELQPEVVFVTASTDVHQDHQVLYGESVRAFKELTLWGYELPWNHITFSAHGFVELKREHVDRKWAALQAYESQIELQRTYFCREFIYGLARVRGEQVKTQYAEAFEVIRVRW
ncbi:MAG TPA: PIG-L deacetylase family protein [Terriglobales bacterium]|jgi:LmbE family N-acetylglucosaminyl deacetylase|nr:PIG-L deacetylase family protein [Terriglobales bacterium]